MPQVKFVRLVLILAEHINLMSYRPKILADVPIDYNGLFDGDILVPHRFLIGDKSFPFINAINTIQLKPFLKPKHRRFRFLLIHPINKSRNDNTINHGFLNVALEELLFAL